MKTRPHTVTRASSTTVVLVVLLLASCTSSKKPDDNALDTDKITGSPPSQLIDARTGIPGAVRLTAPKDLDISDEQKAGESALAVLSQNKSDLKIPNPESDLKLVNSDVDSDGVRHVYFDQQHQGVPVYGGEVAVHFLPDGADVLVGNHFIPEIALAAVVPTLSADQATAAAKGELTGGEMVGKPSLAVYPGKGSSISGKTAVLSWLVDLHDLTVPASNTYVVDAKEGKLVDVIPRLADVLDRSVYNTPTPSQSPTRREGQEATGDTDVDNAYDFLGMTYAYYKDNHLRDSFDKQGSPIIAHTHLNIKNAYWDGNINKIFFGNDYTVLDIAAHELTHAVTQYTATNGLDYVWQSGALNESFSDIFGHMVDNEDWTMGEDLPGGAFRDMEHPERMNHPGHTQDFVVMCEDDQGVHINSGIPNKAFVNLVTQLGDPDTAAALFYKALPYLPKNAIFEELYWYVYEAAGATTESKKAQPVIIEAFNAVGLNGKFNPSPGNCPAFAPGVQTEDDRQSGKNNGG